MLNPGDVIENPVTGERATVRSTGRETNGELCAVDMTVRPGGGVLVAHVHPRQEERFEVVRGTIEVEIDGERTLATAGDTVVAAAGRAHSWRNAGRGRGAARDRVAPRTPFRRVPRRRVQAGPRRQDRRQGPGPRARLGAAGRLYRDEFRMPGPALLYDLYLAVAAPLARLLRIATA